jgi:predicted CXXCH cytochrome family protein
MLTPRPAVLLILGGLGLLSAGVFAQVPLQTTAKTDGYLGSAACQRCHEPEYDTWRNTLHVQMTKPINEAVVVGDFKPGTKLEDGGTGRAYAMDSRDGKYFISISRTGRQPESFEINYTLGARRFQGYLTKLPDGRIYVLPVFWHTESKRWMDYSEITPIPKDSSHDLRQIWNVTCVNCHATNLAKNFDAERNTFASTWTEMGIGCEACHGPGQAHIDDPEHQKTFTMKKVPPRQIFDTCAYCHGNKNKIFFGFKAGDVYEDFALPFLISQPIPDNDPQGEFWPDGRPSRFNRPQALTLTGCFRTGQATCTSCHRIHGNQNNHSLKVAIDAPGGGRSRQSDTLCTQCHRTEARAGMPSEGLRSLSEVPASVRGGGGGPPPLEESWPASEAERQPTPISDLTAHTHHAADSQGSRCINCHMSDVNWRLLTRRLDHTFQPPVPEMTARYGVPSACTTCHEEKSPEWAAATMDKWYGNGERRRAVVTMADTIYRAGSGDASVLSDIAKLAVDRSHGSLIRASAAEFAGQLIAKAGGAGAGRAGGAPPQVEKSWPSPDVVNALIGAAADPEAIVRIAAVRTLGQLREPRLVPVLAARLADSARVVRVSAAESLFNMGVVQLDGIPGTVLAHVQDEWADSLRTFNDDAADHVALGWLEASRGRTVEGERELRTATRLDSGNAQAHVFLGVLAARAGRFDEALQRFRTAKAAFPAYPNIDRLIDEAQKRR